MFTGFDKFPVLFNKNLFSAIRERDDHMAHANVTVLAIQREMKGSYRRNWGYILIVM